MKKVIQILIICVSIILLGCTNKNQSVKIKLGWYFITNLHIVFLDNIVLNLPLKF